jgi:hypothetical protein
MPIILAAASLAAALGAAPPAAPADPMANAYGNTITLSIEPFWRARQYIEPDHTWRQVASDGKVNGTWKVDGDQVCLTQTSPPGPTYCNPVGPHEVGESWTNIDPGTGQTVVIRLVKGRD